MLKNNLKKTTLTKNDIVSLQSLSSGIAGDKAFLHRFNIGKKRVRKMNLNPMVSSNALKGSIYLTKNPQKRAEDLQFACQNAKIKAIFANVGGFDSDQIVDFLDLEQIKQNPKPILGYSDITTLHLLFYYLKIQTFYGPTILDGFAENVKMHPLTKRSLKKTLFTNKKQVICSSKKWTSAFLEWQNEKNDFIKRKMSQEKHGFITLNHSLQKVEGHLLGGNLDTLIRIKNKFYFPKIENWKKSIIFLETSEQKMKPEMFLKALRSLKSELSVCNGVIFGKPKDETYFHEYLQIIKKEINKPVFYNVNFGHCAPLITIPYGACCNLDFKNKKIIISN